MSQLRPFAASVLALCLAAGCDEPKPPSPAPSASPAVSPAAAAPAQSAAPAATTQAAAAPQPRKEVVCPKGTEVAFTDPTLETAVRRQLRKESGAIQRAELAKVRTLDLSQAPSNDALDPCIFPAFTGLKGLYLAPGKLDDLTPIKALTQIESLRVAATMVRDLSPLSGLVKLDRLDIGRTPVSDLSPLARLTSLTELQLDETEITDVSPLAKLEKLEILQMKRTRVSDISPLRGLTRLKHLYLEGSAVKDTSPVLARYGGSRSTKVIEGQAPGREKTLPGGRSTATESWLAQRAARPPRPRRPSAASRGRRTPGSASMPRLPEDLVLGSASVTVRPGIERERSSPRTRAPPPFQLGR